MFTKLSHSPYYYRHNDDDHKIRDRTISLLFDPIRILYEVIIVLIILKLCRVVDYSWAFIALLFAGYELVDYLSDILQIFIERRDNKKADELCLKRIQKRCEMNENEEEEE